MAVDKKNGSIFFGCSHFLLHDEVQRQSQQGVASFLFAVSRNEQQEDNDHQIPGVKIPGQQLPKKTSGALLIAGRLLRRRRWGTGGSLFRLRLNAGRIFRRWGRGPGRFLAGFFHPLAVIGTVRLRNIAVIHGITCRS